MAGTCLSQHVVLTQAEKSAMLLGDIAIANLALTPRAQEGRVNQDDPANDITDLTRHHGRGHPSHRMPQKNRGGESEPSDEAHDVARVIIVPISMERCARPAVPPGIRHHHIEFIFKGAGQRAPAGSVPGQSMQQN
jgi:hypothetical protein